jgi:uncharacterized protein
MADRSLVVGIADLRRRPGSRRRIELAVALDGLAVSTARVPDGAPVEVDLELEALCDGLVATGTVTVPWEGECRRCLEPVRSSSTTDVREIFEPRAVEGETYPLGDDLVDLEPMVRDAALLALPLAPLCRPDCRGPAPDEFPAAVEGEVPDAPSGTLGEPSEAPPDPRWAGLDALRFDSPGGDG